MDFPEDVLSLNSLDELAMMADEVSADELAELIRRLRQGPIQSILNDPRRGDGWPLGWCEALEDLIGMASDLGAEALNELEQLTQPTKLAMISAMLRHGLTTPARHDQAYLPLLVERCLQQLGFHRDQPKPYFHWELDAIKQSWPERRWRPLLIEAAARPDDRLELEVWQWVEQELLPYASDAQRIHIATHHKAAPHSQALGYFDQARAIEVCRQAASPQALEACLSVATRCLGQPSSSQSALFVATVGLAHIADALGRSCPRVDYELWEQLGKALGSALTPHLDAIAHTLPQTHYPGARYQETLRYYDQLNAAAQCPSLYHPDQGDLIEFETQNNNVQQHAWSARRPERTNTSTHQPPPGVEAEALARSLKRARIEQGYIPVMPQAAPMAQLTTHLDRDVHALCLNPSDGTLWACVSGEEPLLRFSHNGELLDKLTLPLTPKAFSVDGLLAGVLHQQGVVYDPTEGTLTVLESEGGLEVMRWSPDGAMIAGLDRFGGLHTWAWSGQGQARRLASRYGAPQHLSKIAFNPYGELLFFGGHGRAHVLRFETLETLKRSEVLPGESGDWLNALGGYLSASSHSMIGHYPLDRAGRSLAQHHHQHRLALCPCVHIQPEHTFRLGHFLTQALSGQLVMLHATHSKHHNHNALALWDVELGQARGVWRVDDYTFNPELCCLNLSLERFFFANHKGLHSFALSPTPSHRVYELHQRALPNELAAREQAYTRGFEARELQDDHSPRARPAIAPRPIKDADASQISPNIYKRTYLATALQELKMMSPEQTEAFFKRCVEQLPVYDATLTQLICDEIADQLELALWFIERLPEQVLLPIFSSKKDIARGDLQFTEDHHAWSYDTNSPKQPHLHTKRLLDQKLREIGWGGLEGLKDRLRQQQRRFCASAKPPLTVNQRLYLGWTLNTAVHECYQGSYFKILKLLSFTVNVETFEVAPYLATMDMMRREQLLRDTRPSPLLDVRLFGLTYEQVGLDAARARLLLQGIQEHRSNTRALMSFLDQHGFTQAQAGPALEQLGLTWPSAA